MQRICNFLDLQENYQVNQKAATREGYVKMYPILILKNAEGWPQIIQVLQSHAN